MYCNNWITETLKIYPWIEIWVNRKDRCQAHHRNPNYKRHPILELLSKCIRNISTKDYILQGLHPVLRQERPQPGHSECQRREHKRCKARPLSILERAHNIQFLPDNGKSKRLKALFLNVNFHCSLDFFLGFGYFKTTF